MSADFVVKIVDRVTAPARAMAKALKAMRTAEMAVQAASKGAQTAVTAAGQAFATSGARAMQGARSFERAAQSMRIAARNASYAQVRLGFAAGGGARRAAAFAGGRRMLGSVGLGARHGPVYDPSAQGAAAGGMGPILDRRAQGFSFATRVGHGISDGARSLARWNTAAGETISKWQDLSSAFMRTPFGMVLGGLGKIGGALFDLVKWLGSAILGAGKLSIALGVVAAAGFTKLAVEMGAFAERSKRALGYITGSDALGKQEFKQAVELSKELGTSVEDTVSQYSKLRSMQFSAIEATGLVRLSTDLKAITGDAQSAERALTAMTQIKAKGRLQSEELVGQLAEAGVSTVLVYKELEKMLGTDRKGVLSSLQKGAIDSETGLVAIVRALKQKYHVKEVGRIGENFANNTVSGLWGSLKNAPARAFLRIGEAIDTTPLVKGLKTLKMAFDGAFSSGAPVRFVNVMLVNLKKLIPMVVSFAEGFGTGLDGIAKALSFGDAADVAGWAKEAGASTAEFFTKVIEVSKKAVPAAVEAIGALFEGLNVNQILSDLKGFDWKQFGSDLVVIAKALGSIVGDLSQLIQPASRAASFAINPGETWRKNTGGQLSWEQAINPWYTPEAATPSVEPTMGPSASRGAIAPVFQNTFYVNGDVSSETVAALREGAKAGSKDGLAETAALVTQAG